MLSRSNSTELPSLVDVVLSFLDQKGFPQFPALQVGSEGQDLTFFHSM